MQVKVSRSGGVAGLIRRGVVELDDAGPGVAHVTELIAGAESTPRGRPGDSGRASPVRDDFTWTIEAAGRRAVIPDRQLTGPLRELVQRALRTPDTDGR